MIPPRVAQQIANPLANLPEFDYELRTEGRSLNLVLRCQACQGPEGILNPQCLAVVLKILSTESFADLVTFTGITQRQYGGQAVELLKRLVQFSKLLDQLSGRQPLPFAGGIVYPDGQVDEVIADLERVATTPGALPGPLLTVEGNPTNLTPPMAAEIARNARLQRANMQRHFRRLDCARCAYNPQNIFPGLKNLLMTDLRSFALDLRQKAQVLAQGPPDEGCSRCLAFTLSDLEYLSDQMVELDGFVRSRGTSSGDGGAGSPNRAPNPAAPAQPAPRIAAGGQ
jgi:hypothetical protein